MLVPHHESAVNTYLPTSAQASAPQAIPSRFPPPLGSPAYGYRLQYIRPSARRLRCLPAGGLSPLASARFRLSADVQAPRVTAVLALQLQPERPAYAAVEYARPLATQRLRYALD